MPTEPSPTDTRTDSSTDTPTAERWAVSYDADPIRIRDPVAEALALLPPGEPFVFGYPDLVRVAGHSCPTAAGAYRVAQVGLDALYPDDLPVRSEIEVMLPGPRTDPTDGLFGRLLSAVTGAAGVGGFGGLAGGFGGLAGGFGDRQELLRYDAFEAETSDPTVRFRRTDTDRTVEVTYHVGDVPAAGPAVQHLDALVAGTASDEQRAAFREAWHGRVQRILDADDLFTVTDVQ